jgi:hypothetical protein
MNVPMETPRGTQPAMTAFVLAQLRRLSDEGSRLEGMAAERGGEATTAETMDRLSEIPPWRADELFECAGGPTAIWPGEWLG